MNYLHFPTMKSTPGIRILPPDELKYRSAEARLYSISYETIPGHSLLGESITGERNYYFFYEKIKFTTLLNTCII